MGKIYIGWELSKAIADGKIKEGSKIKTNEDIFTFCEGNFMSDDTAYYLTSIYDDIIFATAKFELIEDEIDIDSIKEMELDVIDDVTYYINDLIKAVKQIDKRVKRLEKYKNGD